MIRRKAIVAPDGWVTGLLMREGPAAPATNQVPLTDVEYHHASLMPLHHGPDGLELPQDDRVAWKRIRTRGVSGHEAASLLALVRERRGLFPRDLSVPVPDPPPLMAGGAPPAAAFPDVPGLTLEPMHAGHLDEAAAIAIAAGLAPAICPDGRCQPPEAHAWLHLAGRLDDRDQWQFALSFQGRPLQYETIVFDPQRTVATFSITYHTTAGRERPSWFHHEAEQPIFAAMQQVGIRTLVSRTRADRPDWIASLQARYGAVDTGPLSGGTIRRLEFPLEMSRFTGWPVRRTLGEAWQFEQAGLVVREARPDEFASLKTWAEAEFASDRKALATRMLDEWSALDRGTILLARQGADLVDLRIIRPRRPQMGSLGAPAPIRAASAARSAITEGVYAWCVAAGYTGLSMFVPGVQARATGQAFHDRLTSVGWQSVQTKTYASDTYEEMVLPDLSAAIATLRSRP